MIFTVFDTLPLKILASM